MITEETKIRIVKGLITLVLILVLAGNWIVHVYRRPVQKNNTNVEYVHEMVYTKTDDSSGEEIVRLHFYPLACTIATVEEFKEIYPGTFNKHYDMLNQPDKNIVIFDVRFTNELDKKANLAEAAASLRYLAQANSDSATLVYIDDYMESEIRAKTMGVAAFAAVADYRSPYEDCYERYINAHAYMVFEQNSEEKRMIFDKIQINSELEPIA